MPSPRPAAQPQFTPDDIVVLQTLVRKPSLPYRTVQRAKLALLLHADPALPSPVAAAQLGQRGVVEGRGATQPVMLLEARDRDL